MKYTIDQLSYVVPAFSIGFLLIITSINVYFKIRRKFPATVNCWFCNENSRVPYANKNSWTCSKCEQYNGFNEDGNYNCDIPAQRSAKLNTKAFVSATPSMNGSMMSDRVRPVNGLCQPCNRNQELKVQQLASFEPENEAYFDEEIDIYRAKLEQAYRLCPRCERHLKRTLNKVKSNILGSKLKQIGAKGFRAFDLGLSDDANKKQIYQKRNLFARCLSMALIVISLLHLYVTCKQIDVTKGKLDAIFDASTTLTILTILSYLSAMKIMISHCIQHVLSLPFVSMATATSQSTIDYLYTFSGGEIWSIIDTEFLQNINASTAIEDAGIASTMLLNISGCFMSTILLYLRGLEIQPIMTILLWSGNIIMPTMTQGVADPAQLLIFDIIKFALAWFTTTLSVVSLFSSASTKTVATPNNNNSSFHRIDDDDSTSEISDVSDLDLSHLSSVSKRSWNNTKLMNSTIASLKAPSVISGLSSMHRHEKTFSTQSINGIGSRGRRSPSFETADDYRFDRNASIVREQLNRSSSRFSIAAPSSHHNTSRRSLMSPLSNTFSHADYDDSTLRSASRNSYYDMPNDFESSITQLSIHGDGPKQRRRTHGFGSADHLREPMQQHKPVLFPSRLSAKENHMAGNQSWVGGGYWKNTSPHKKSAFELDSNPMEQYAMEPPTMISRTSSRSSGFESMAPNSIANNSRENSLCDDFEMEKTFVCGDRMGETTFLSPPQRFADTTFAAPIPQRFVDRNALNMSSLSIAGHSNRSSAASVFDASFAPRHHSLTPRPNSVYNMPQRSTLNAGKPHANEQLAKNFENFISFKNDMPMTNPYQRGSLIKLNNDNNGM